jgi:predicted nucleic acid-binding protein
VPVIYLDTSVALAEVLAEDRKPDPAIWREPLVASRLLQYEMWGRVHARGLVATHGETVRDLLARISFLELAPPVLARALDPFPTPVRTLDALHLASVEFLRAQRVDVALATFDARMRSAALALGIPLAF